MSAHPTTQKIHEYMHRDIVTIAPEATLQEASQVMKEMGVGALLVKEKKAYVGILSETQLTREGMAKGFNAKTHSVRNIMKKNDGVD
jgi:predicted transcriptional regulator